MTAETTITVHRTMGRDAVALYTLQENTIMCYLQNRLKKTYDNVKWKYACQSGAYNPKVSHGGFGQPSWKPQNTIISINEILKLQ